MTDTFNWEVTTETNGKVTGKVKRAQFADGYAQSSADGINPASGAYDITVAGYKAELQPIAAFLNAHLGKSFFYTPLLIGQQGYYQCDEWSFKNVGGKFYTLSATFTQTFQA